jgi:Putative Ig domain
VQNPDKSVSNAATFTVTGPVVGSPPTVASISPASASAGSSSLLQITVTGSNFFNSISTANGSVVQWNSTPLSTSFVSTTQLTALIASSLLQSAGSAFVTVINPGNVSSGGVTFAVNGPTLASIVPATITAGGPAFSVSLFGTNFVSGSTAVWNGVNLTTVFGSPTQLTAQVPANLIASSGTSFLLVANTGGAFSSPVVFNATVPSAPTVTNLNPSFAVAGASTFQLTLLGGNFVSGSAVLWNGASVPTAYTSSTQVSALIDSALIAAVGSVNITVQNPGSSPSTPLKFTVSGPSIASLSPTGANAGDPALSLTVIGANFVSGASVLWNGTPLPTAFVSGSSPQLVATVSASLMKTPTLASITVQNPGGAASGSQSFTIGSPSLVITTTTLPDAVVGVFYSQTLAATGGNLPYTWSITGGTLPDGFQLTATGGVISGTAAGAISAVLSVTVTDSGGRTTTGSLPLRAALPVSITTISPISQATAGGLYSATLVATGGTAPYLWTGPAVCGTNNQGNCLPVGLNLNISTGEISGIPQTPGGYLFTISVTDSRQQQTANKSFSLAIGISTFTLAGPSASSAPAQQVPLQISSGIAYPVDLSGTLTLLFVSAVGGDDPSIQFSTGGRTANFTIPAGSTTAAYGKASQLLVSTGTVAGTITVSSTLSTGLTVITPNPVPQISTTISKLPPVITGVTLKAVTGGVSVGISGYSTTKEATVATLVFNAASGATLSAAPISVPVSSILSTWYSGTAAASFGSQFLITIPIAVTGTVSAIGSVTVTLTNTMGVSAPVNGTLQ